MKVYIKSSTASYVAFTELTSEQQEEVLEMAYYDKRLSMDMHQRYFDYMYELYHDEVQALADDLEAETGIVADIEKLYWDVNNHGVYQEWDLNDVFGNASDTNNRSAKRFIDSAWGVIQNTCEANPYDDCIWEMLEDTGKSFIIDGDNIRYLF